MGLGSSDGVNHPRQFWITYYISLYKDNAGPIFVGSWRKESNVFRLHSYDNTDILLKIKNIKSKILNIPTLSSYGWRNQSEKI